MCTRPGRKPWLRKWAPVLTVLGVVGMVEVVSRQSLFQPLFWAVRFPVPAFLNVLLAGLLVAFLAAVFGSARRGGVAALSLLALLAAVHGAKMQILGNALYPWDLWLVREALNIFKRGYLPFSPIQVLIFLLLVAAAALPAWALSNRMMSGRRRVVLSLFLLSALVGAGTYRAWPLRHVVETIVKAYTWDQRQNYQTNGVLLAFTMNMQAPGVPMPEDYSPETMAALANRLRPEDKSPRPYDPRPINLIVFLNESFWDATAMPGVRFHTDPLANYRRLSRSHSSFRVISPVFGGWTCNAEFELLTGLPVALLPGGSIPYQQYIQRPCLSLTRILKDHGYSTLAVHPFHHWYWNRHQVYGHIGFDRFIALEDWEVWTMYGDYVGDASLAEKVISLSSEQPEPYFIFALSIQNHGPYEHRHYEDGAHDMEIETDLPEAGHAAIENMAKGLQDGDAALARLVEHFSAVEQPTMIVYLGDHLPSLGPDHDLYRRSGLVRGEGALSAEELVRLHTVPALIWTNYSQESADLGEMSMMYVMPLILERLGLGDSIPLVKFLRELKERFPVLTDQFHVSQGRLHPGLPEDDPLLMDCRMILYDLLRGGQHALTELASPGLPLMPEDPPDPAGEIQDSI